MWEINQVICIGMLTILSAVDIYCRKIPVNILILANLAVSGYQILTRKDDVWLIMGGIAIGGVFLLVSKVTGEGMGYADSWAILILGIYLGLWELVEVLAGAFFLLAAASAVCLTVKKMSRKCRLPFFPFLAAGYLLSILV